MGELKDIAFSFQCKESWEKMKPGEGGKFCNVCQKLVYDFSNFSKEQYQDFLQSQTVPFCGNFKTEQTVYHKSKSFSFQKWVYGLLISLGFISCGDKRNQRGGIRPQQKQHGVQVNLNPDIRSPEFTQPPAILGGICITKPDTIHQPETKEEDCTLGMLPVLPQYKDGGESGMMKFLQENLQLKDSVYGKVIVEYKVNKQGEVINSKIIKPLSPENDKEVLRVINLLKYDASGDTATFTLPIIFDQE